MDAKEYSDLVKDYLDQCHALAMRKFHQYARDGDPFHSIRKIAERNGQTVQEAIDYAITKKDVSIECMDPCEKKHDEYQDKIVYTMMKDIHEGNGRTLGFQNTMQSKQEVRG